MWVAVALGLWGSWDAAFAGDLPIPSVKLSRSHKKLLQAYRKEGSAAQQKQLVDESRRWNNACLQQSALGQAEDAVEACARSTRLLEGAVGDVHPTVGLMLSNTGQMLFNAGRIEEAEAATRRAVVVLSDRLGFAHLDTARASSLLGGILEYLGRSAEAEPFLRKALATHLALSAPDDVEIVRDLARLGRVLQSLGRAEEAEPPLRQALAIAERIEPEPPERSLVRESLADVLMDVGNAEEAAEHYHALVVRRQAVHGGIEHIEVADALNKLAGALIALGDVERARLSVIGALDYARRIQDPRATQRYAGNYVMVLVAQGRAEEAEVKARSGVEMSELIFGRQHPEVSRALTYLGEALLASNRADEAEPVAERALAIAARTRPETHPDVQKARRLLVRIQGGAPNGAGEPIPNRLAEIDALIGAGLIDDAVLEAQGWADEVEATVGTVHPRLLEARRVEGILLQSLDRFVEAEMAYQQAVGIARDLAPTTAQTGELLNLYALTLNQQRRHDEALPLFRESLEILERALGEDHPDLSDVMLNQGRVLQQLGRHDEAEPWLTGVLERVEAHHGPTHPKVAEALSALARLWDQSERSADAEPLARRALAIARAAADPRELGRDLVTLGRILLSLDRLEEAETTLREALDVGQRASDPRAVGLAQASLAAVLTTDGRYPEAEPLLRRALANTEAAEGGDHPQVAFRLQSLAQTLTSMGQFAEAGRLLDRAIQIVETTYGGDHPLVATVYQAKGGWAADKGRYAEAEQYLRKALAIDEATSGADHPSVASDLRDLGDLLRLTGKPDEGVRLLRRAVAIEEAALGTEDPRYATSLNALAVALSDRYPREAERLLDQALAIAERVHGSDHLLVASRSNNLGTLYLSMGRHRKAERAFERSLRIVRARWGDQHPDVAMALNNLAFVKKEQGRMAEAEDLLRTAVAINERVLGENHPAVGTILSTLGLLLDRQDRMDEALPVFVRGLEIEEDDLHENLLVGTPEDRRQRFDAFRLSSWYAISRHLQKAPDDRASAELALRTWLRRKGRLAALEATLLANVRASSDAETRVLLDRIQVLTSRLASMGNRPVERGERETWQREQDRLTTERTTLLRQLTERSRVAREGLRRVSLSDVAAQLPAKSRLVEFAVYRPLLSGANQGFGADRYAAYVLDADGDVRGVDLGPADTLDAQFTAFRDAVVARRPSARAAKALFDATFGVLGLPADTAHVFLATDGRSSLVPFDALFAMGSAGTAPTISYLTSGRELLRDPPRDDPGPPVVVYDVDYAAADRPEGPIAPSAPSRRWSPLLHVGAEGRAITKSLRRADPTVLRGAAATETALKRLERPSVLHVASHGYIDATSPPLAGRVRGVNAVVKELPPVVPESEHPMLRSGLVLAGANLPAVGADDGLLSSDELATVDLRGTRLVVLSACSTAEGELRNGDGVYGLRRALVLAGSRSQVLSLWSVDDEATAFLMMRLYEGLRSGQTVREALASAKAAVRAQDRWSLPYYWAAFTLSGAPEVTLPR